LGVVFTIIAIFMAVAALQHNCQQAVGLDEPYVNWRFSPLVNCCSVLSLWG